MTTKTRRILEALSRDELQALGTQNGLRVRDRRVRDELIEAVVRSREVDLAAHLVGFSHDRLKEICRTLGLDDSGKEKAAIVARILGAEPAPAAKVTKQTVLDLEPSATPPPCAPLRKHHVLPWDSPGADLRAARALIERYGYGRCLEDFADAEAYLLQAAP